MIRNLWSNFVKLMARWGGLHQERAHHFYPASLNADSLVIDLGAHKGEFTRFITSQYGCRVLGLEANPHLYKQLPNLPRAQFINCAINRDDAPIGFHVSENLEASSVIEEVAQAAGLLTKVTVPGITLNSLIGKNNVARIDLLKVDIESAEYEMLEIASDETLSLASQITVEFHLKAGSVDYSIDRIMKISQRLDRLGFKTYVMDKEFTDVLFLKTKRLPLKLGQRMALAIYRMIVMPIRRVMNR